MADRQWWRWWRRNEHRRRVAQYRATFRRLNPPEKVVSHSWKARYRIEGNALSSRSHSVTCEGGSRSGSSKTRSVRTYLFFDLSVRRFLIFIRPTLPFRLRPLIPNVVDLRCSVAYSRSSMCSTLTLIFLMGTREVEVSISRNRIR